MQEQYNQSQPRWQEFAVKASLFTLGGAVLDGLLDEPNDTANYTLYYKSKRCIMAFLMKIVLMGVSINMSGQVLSLLMTAFMTILKPAQKQWN